MHIGTEQQFEEVFNSIVISGGDVLKFFARNPGAWGNSVEIAIANPEDFRSGKKAFPGIDLDGMFEYVPDAGNAELGIVIKVGSTVKEIFTVSLNKDSKDINHKSNFIETLLNRKSQYVFCKYVGEPADGLVSCLGTDAVVLSAGTDVDITKNDLSTAYEVWSNREEVDVDIVIGNEFDDGDAAFALAESRKDCIAFIGTDYSIVGLKAAQATAKTVENRGDRNSMFACYGGNYAYQYDRYNDKNRWMNIAGHIAGLRAQTSSSRASWWASAGQ